MLRATRVSVMCCSSGRNVALGKCTKGGALCEIGRRLLLGACKAAATQAQPVSVEWHAVRLFILIPAIFLFADPAAAQSWQEYSYPYYSFRVSFPADPKLESTTYQVSDDRAVEAHVYSVQRDNAEFKVTIAELGDPSPPEAAVVDHAIKTLSEGGEVKVNIPHRINRVFGRQLSILQADGSRASVALFDYNGRLYQIEGKSLASGSDGTADAIRFVQSLVFTGNGSNRSADEIRAGRPTCNGATGGGTADAQGAAGDGRRFEVRCRRQQSFGALVSSLNSGDLSGAQQAYASLSQLANNDQGRLANPNGPFAQAMSRIGQALQSGDLAGAQQALSSLRRQRDGGPRQP